MTFAGTEFTTDGLVNGDSVSGVTLTSDGAAATAPVSGSPYAIVASDAAGSGLDNYTISYTNGSLTVGKATLTVTANDVHKTYGAAVPTLTGSIVGIKNGDVITLNNTTSATSASHVGQGNGLSGNYVITAGVNGDLSNYDVTYSDGLLIIDKATLTVTASNTTMVLGGPVPTFSAYYIGLVNGDSVSKLGGSLTFTPGDTSNAGTTTIALRGNLTDSDYTIEYNPGTLTVKVPTKPIIIGLPPSKTKTLDQATGTTLGEFGPIYLTYGQTLNQVVNDGITPAKVNINGTDVEGTWTFADASNPTKDLTQAVLDAGSHTTDLTATFHPSDTADLGDNYTAATVDVEVAKAKIAIVANSYEKTYGHANPTLTDTIYTDLGPSTGIDPITGNDYSTETDPNTGKPYEVHTQLKSH